MPRGAQTFRESHAQPEQPRLLSDALALTKPSINLMVLVTTLGGIWLAPHRPQWLLIFATIVGSCLIVGAANTLNCYLERDVDRFMTRTANRPLPSGRLSPRFALLWGLFLALASLPLLYFWVNPLTAALGLFALVSYVWVYTPMKQRSAYALWVGAVPGAMPPLMGWTAATGTLDWPGVLLFAILFLWQLPHFLAIAAFRQREYERAGIVVYPSVHGTRAAFVSGFVHALVLIPVAFMLVPFGVLGNVFGVSAILLGAAFAGVCYYAVARHHELRWQRRVFFASLLYLPALIGAIALDVMLRWYTS